MLDEDAGRLTLIAFFAGASCITGAGRGAGGGDGGGGVSGGGALGTATFGWGDQAHLQRIAPALMHRFMEWPRPHLPPGDAHKQQVQQQGGGKTHPQPSAVARRLAPAQLMQQGTGRAVQGSQAADSGIGRRPAVMFDLRWVFDGASLRCMGNARPWPSGRACGSRKTNPGRWGSPPPQCNLTLPRDRSRLCGRRRAPYPAMTAPASYTPGRP